MPPQLNMAKGLIPLPPMATDIIDVTKRNPSDACRGYDRLGPRQDPPRFLVLHRSQCPAGASNSGYFHQACCPALTDLEVVAATGQARRFVRLDSGIAGWANGRVSGAYGDAKAYLDWYGWDLKQVNRDGESCEITGSFAESGQGPDDPVSEAAWAWLAQWIASRAHDYGITYLDFPLIPQEGGRSYLTWHQEWTIGTGKVVMDYTPTLIERARAIMQKAQTGAQPTPATTTTPAPSVDPAAGFGSATYNGTTYKYDPKGAISALWKARGDKTGKYPALLAVAERPQGGGAVSRYFVFADGTVAFTPKDGAPPAWLGAA